MMPGHYPDKPPTASDGEAFAALGAWLMATFLEEKITVYPDKDSQFNIGESREGVEFKELKNSHTRLHIELAEKTAADRPWVRSGILRRDNTRRYMCGHHEDVFLFRKSDLLAWRRRCSPPEIWYGKDIHGIYRLGEVRDPELAATVWSFIIDKPDAASLCLCRLSRCPEWAVTGGYLILGTPLESIRDELRSGTGDLRRRRALWLTLDWLTAKHRPARPT